MTLPEYSTTNCGAFKEFWGDENDSRFACKLCGKQWPNKVRVYANHTRVCGDRHTEFHRVYEVLNELEHELLGDRFNALTVTLKLSEEGII